MTIRPGAPADVPSIGRIQSEDPLWPASDYLDHDLWVAEVAGEVAAFAVLRTLAPGEREILAVAVDPARRRRGVGRALLAHVLALTPGEVYLEVRASNTAARSLYSTLGFTAIGRRRAYYSNPVEDALVLRVVTRDPEC